MIIFSGKDDAESALEDIMRKRVFGAAGERVVIEERLEGEEVSFMALFDGEHFLPLASSQDHKRVFDHDQGLNTGGMGAYSPAPIVTPSLHAAIVEQVLTPLLLGLKRRGIVYRGVLYAGLMITGDGPKVLEFNARFGDPECQPIMMRMESDFVPLLLATAEGRLNEVQVAWKEQASVCVVLASGGYPGNYDKGLAITGLESLAAWPRGYVFHAGTRYQNNCWRTNGGRVLGVTALGDDIAAATREAYAGVSKITWQDMHHRRDIAARATQG